MDLGSLFAPQPQPQAAPNPELKAQWDGWLSDPANKAGLLSFGLQAMAGGWGNGTQQLSAALGAGAESAGGMQKMQMDRDLEERRNNEARADKEATRSLQRELNDADNKAAMERTKVAKEGRGGGSYDRSEQSYWDRMSALKLRQLEARNKQARDPLNKQLDPTLQELSEEEMIIEADRFADELVAKRRGERGQEADTGKKTSGISTDGNGSVGIPPDAKTPATEPPSEGTIKEGIDKQSYGSELIDKFKETATNSSDPKDFKGARGAPSAPKAASKDITPYLGVIGSNINNPVVRLKLQNLGYKLPPIAGQK